eukprot:tig00000492_g1493.t1
MVPRAARMSRFAFINELPHMQRLARLIRLGESFQRGVLGTTREVVGDMPAPPVLAEPNVDVAQQFGVDMMGFMYKIAGNIPPYVRLPRLRGMFLQFKRELVAVALLCQEHPGNDLRACLFDPLNEMFLKGQIKAVEDEANLMQLALVQVAYYLIPRDWIRGPIRLRQACLEEIWTFYAFVDRHFSTGARQRPIPQFLRKLWNREPDRERSRLRSLDYEKLVEYLAMATRLKTIVKLYINPPGPAVLSDDDFDRIMQFAYDNRQVIDLHPFGERAYSDKALEITRGLTEGDEVPVIPVIPVALQAPRQLRDPADGMYAARGYTRPASRWG